MTRAQDSRAALAGSAVVSPFVLQATVSAGSAVVSPAFQRTHHSSPITHPFLRRAPTPDPWHLLTALHVALMQTELENGDEDGQRHSILELHGLGKEIWQGVDPKEDYVKKLRDEWV